MLCSCYVIPIVYGESQLAHSRLGLIVPEYESFTPAAATGLSSTSSRQSSMLIRLMYYLHEIADPNHVLYRRSLPPCPLLFFSIGQKLHVNLLGFD